MKPYRRGSTITDNYLDGVSITSNLTHVWSFVAADCECSYTQTFISNDWTCDVLDVALVNFVTDFCGILVFVDNKLHS